MERSSGILMPVFSLPSPYGIGSFGRAAYEFIDFLKASGQRYWQILPLNPTGYGDSPYQCFSAFAGNPYFIDLDLLIDDGLLTREQVEGYDFGTDRERVDYGKLYLNRFKLLAAAKQKGYERDSAEISAFLKENASWLEDYLLFTALKQYFGMEPWHKWPDKKAVHRNADTLKRYKHLLRDELELLLYTQFLFFRQWQALREYAHKQGVFLIGDLPIYVSYDSADVWASPEQFLLDTDGTPSLVAGVPPDAFSSDGQLWGNPIYRWEKMEQEGFSWWLDRIEGASKLYDVIRIDHFRGLESYWAVPYGETTAKNGSWQPGPGINFISAVKKAFPDLPIIAEDLGVLTDEVNLLLHRSGFPGMRVLEFAFDSDEANNYLPHNYIRSCVCYTGTHDNAPVAGWLCEIDEKTLNFAKKYLALNAVEGESFGVIRGGMGSVADLFIAQMQDYLNLGIVSRINTPGTSENNWQWRLLPGMLTDELSKRILSLTRMFGRLCS